MKKRILSLLLAAVMLLTILPQLPKETNAHQIVMTAEEFIDCLWTAYNRPNKYKNVYPYNLGYYDGSVIHFDCWNLGKAIIWSKGAIVNNYTVGHYASMDTSCGLGDWDGLTIVKEAPNCSTDFTNLVPGEWLYMENHTGYYVGNGQVIECTTGWGVNCITISQIDSYGNRSRNGDYRGKWEYHGMVPWLDYEADKDHWVTDSVGKRYQYADGSYAVGWTVIDGAWYYFSPSTYMYTGWYYDEGYEGWYFLDPTSGIMQTGFIYVNGYHYYMDSSGKMLLGWQKIDGYWYYFNTTDYWPEGAMFTGWHEIDGEYYFFSEATGAGRGAMQTGWVCIESDWYYCNADGARQYGWQNIDGAWYYLTEPHGIMAERAWILDGDQWVYVNASGARTEGAAWTVGGTYADALDIGTEFYATIDIPSTGTRAGVDSDETSSTYKNLEVQAVRAEDAEDYQEQLWYFVRREDGSYRITNAATGLCLDVEGGYVEKGTNVRVWNGNDAIAQKWFIYSDGENYGMVSACNAWDKTVLDVADGLADEGTNIRIWSYNGSGAQQFMVTPIVEPATVTGKSFTLSFEDEILVNFYYTVSDLTSVTEHGMLVFDSDPGTASYDAADAVYNETVYDSAKDRYMATTAGIAPKEMGDTRYYVAYAKLTDGSYVYSSIYGYSPKKYATNMLAKESASDKQKALCVAMLNYGTAAQEYFGYNTDALMNAELTADQQALVIDYDKTLFTGAVAADTNKVGNFAATSTGFSKKTATVSFEGAFCVNYYFTPNATVSGDMTLYVWTPEAYAAADVLTADNAETITMLAGTDGRYWGQLSGIAAKSLDETYYVAGVYTDADGNICCTGVIAYSLSKYCLSKAVDGNEMQELAAATAMYGYYAKLYFA